MIDQTLKQFKMSNDDEVICEVIEWNNEENDAVIVRNVMKVVHVEDFEKSIRFYAFRPWMTFMDDPDELHSINSGHIIAEVTPSIEIVKHYINALKEMKDAKRTKKKKASASLDDLAQKMHDMDEDEFEMYLDQLAELADLAGPDSDLGENVIKFKPKKGTLH